MLLLCDVSFYLLTYLVLEKSLVSLKSLI